MMYSKFPNNCNRIEDMLWIRHFFAFLDPDITNHIQKSDRKSKSFPNIEKSLKRIHQINISHLKNPNLSVVLWFTWLHNHLFKIYKSSLLVECYSVNFYGYAGNLSVFVPCKMILCKELLITESVIYRFFYLTEGSGCLCKVRYLAAW